MTYIGRHLGSTLSQKKKLWSLFSESRHVDDLCHKHESFGHLHANNLFPGPFSRGEYVLIYKWTGSRFEVAHRVPTVERAYGVKALSVDGTQFLAVARWKAESSLVFRWNGTQFELFQEVPSRRVRYLVGVLHA